MIARLLSYVSFTICFKQGIFEMLIPLSKSYSSSLVLCSTDEKSDEKDPGGSFIFTFDPEKTCINKTKTQYMKNFYPLLNIYLIHASNFLYILLLTVFWVLSVMIHLGRQRNLLSEGKEPSSNKETIFLAFVKQEN